MNEHIVALGVDILAILVSDVEKSVFILVVRVVLTWLIFEQKNIEMFFSLVPPYAVNAHRSVKMVCNFKTSVFIVSVENQISVVLKFQSRTAYVTRLDAPSGFVSSVLRNDGCQFRFAVVNAHRCQIHADVELLARCSVIYVGISRNCCSNEDFSVNDIEICGERRLFFAFPIFEDDKFVVSR